MNRKFPKPSPGRRPGNEPDARQALLDAARRCFLAKSYDAVSIRELAATAGVNPAMIHYYFGSKASLYISLFEETVSPVLKRLTEAVNTDEDLDVVVKMYLRTLNKHPWLPTLLLRDILSGAGPLQEEFAKRIAGRAGGLIRTLVEHAQAEGRVREDVEPRLAALSLISLCVFPLVAAPVAGRALDLNYNEDFIEKLINHNVRVLREGIYL